VRTTSILGATAALLLLVGCGGGNGGGSVRRGEVTGIVFDTDGKPVANATVSVDSGGHRETRTDSAGRYVLGDVADLDVIVKAEFQAGSSDPAFFGQNLGRVFGEESTPNVNITLYGENDLVTLTGQVRDSAGKVVVGARVFARSNDANVVSYSSASALTDRDGLYTIGRLATNVQYQIVSSARNYGDGSATKTIPTNPNATERTQDLVLSSLTSAAPTTPTGLDAIAYTTPGSTTTRSVGSKAQRVAAYAGLKLLRHPKQGKKGAARDTINGSPISIDLTWNEYPLNPTVRPAGFIVYRNETPAVDNGYFLQDPLAALFSDSDVNLVENTTYTYTMKAVSTGFSDSSNVGRSDLSASVSATPLPDLFAQSSGATVSWNAVSGATNYTVYVYNRYPDIYASDALVATQSTSGTSLTVSDPDVTAGGTYYTIVVGARADGSAETYSEVGTLRP